MHIYIYMYIYTYINIYIYFLNIHKKKEFNTLDYAILAKIQ